MSVFFLSDKITFPPPEYAEEGGLIAVGGDLTEDRLLLAYSMGIFPWYSEGLPILWWSPDPRLILIPEELRISRSLSQTIKKGNYILYSLFFLDKHKRLCYIINMKCPYCGHKIPTNKIAAEMGRKGGKVSSNVKRAAAQARETRKREEKYHG